MKTLILAVLSIAMSVAAQFSLKAGMSSDGVRSALAGSPAPSHWATIAASPGVLLGFLLYGLGAVVWLAVLAKWEVSKAYPLVGLGFVMSLVVGWWLGEAVSITRVVGVGLIAAGVLLVSRS